MHRAHPLLAPPLKEYRPQSREKRGPVSTPLGTVSRIYRYPVKSLAAEPLEHATLDERGLEGDRGRALFVTTQTHVRAERTYRGKENELLHTLHAQEAARELGTTRGVALDVRKDGPYFDAAPVSILFDTWIAKLEALVHEPIDPLRFRPNIYIEAADRFSAEEAALVGKTFRIGSAFLRCTATIERCVTITYDIPTGRRDPKIARAVAQNLNNVMGIYCDVTTNGQFTTGDALIETTGG